MDCFPLCNAMQLAVTIVWVWILPYFDTEMVQMSSVSLTFSDQYLLCEPWTCGLYVFDQNWEYQSFCCLLSWQQDKI